MSNLIVLAFDREQTAGDFLDEIGELQKQGLLKLDDAATVVRSKDGKVKVKQAQSLVGAGALGGAFWGMLIGLLFFAPVAGMVVGSAVGAGIGKASDYGVNDDFIKELGDKLEPGTSAILVLVHDVEPEKVINDLKQLGGEVIHTSLSTEQESRLKDAFATV
jgi:uncharacterized membrane protein